MKTIVGDSSACLAIWDTRPGRVSQPNQRSHESVSGPRAQGPKAGDRRAGKATYAVFGQRSQPTVRYQLAVLFHKDGIEDGHFGALLRRWTHGDVSM